ncbi:DUF305 domain-containing protein [Streptomyces chrestomyceticus]|uniref:DUF305 domain-containing protein n=1 Tax=Streptomyces chrestomyceticus TaxID=68185 RepID=UPI0033E7F374
MHRGERLPCRRVALAGALAAGALALAACGSDDGGGPRTASASAAASPTGSASEAAHNDADVRFMQRMIPHHRQAVEMTEPAGARAFDQEVKSLAAAISKEQTAEIATMRGWLRSWGEPEAAATGSGDPGSPSAEHSPHGMDHGQVGRDESDMDGMVSDQDMAALKDAEGAAFDRKFTELMIGHHEGAIQMARTERKLGRDTGAKQLADSVVRSQSAQVAQLKALRDRLPPR